ncbi:MAG: hypothetical protein ACKOD1_05205 [Sphingomonadales bacterium]
MKDKILAHLDDAAQLESLYRSNKPAFRSAFYEVYNEIADRPQAAFWHQRLSFRAAPAPTQKRGDLLFLVAAALLTAFLVKLPVLAGLDEDRYYPRNISFILFTSLLIYFARKNRLPAALAGAVAMLVLAGAFFINWLPSATDSSTFILSCVHLPLFFWAVLGYVHTGAPSLMRWEKRPDFLRYNGDMIILVSIMTSAVMAISGITMGLFGLIGIDIGEFYFQWILVIELSACPLIATYILDSNPRLVSKVSPIIARIFSPVVLVTLVGYLIAMAWASKDPFNDREFLLLFNLLLIGVLAIVFFSLVELPRAASGRGALLITLLLSVVTIVVNGIALLAILYRISSWGFTPNRLAVLGANLLFFVHLVMIAFQLTKQFRIKETSFTAIEKTIAVFLPLYAGWALFVAVVVPLIFRFS